MTTISPRLLVRFALVASFLAPTVGVQAQVQGDSSAPRVQNEVERNDPRVARIAMEPDTRRLQPGPDEHLLLLGQGALQRAPGMNAEPFSYTCELNPRTGQVLAVRTSV